MVAMAPHWETCRSSIAPGDQSAAALFRVGRVSETVHNLSSLDPFTLRPIAGSSRFDHRGDSGHFEKEDGSVADDCSPLRPRLR